MHGVAEQEAFADAGFFQAGFHLGGDVEVFAAAGGLEKEFFAVGFHGVVCF